MRRRDFVAAIGGATAWPLAARAQQGERVRRISVLTGTDESQEIVANLVVFKNELAKLGWREGRNLRIDERFGRGDADRIRAIATEIVHLAPDAIVAVGAVMVRVLQRQTQTIPIVTIAAGDVFAEGLVKNPSHPEGNVTGVTNLFRSIAGKWIELLKDAVPPVQRVGYIHNAQLPRPLDLFPEVEKAARFLGVSAAAIPFQNAVDLAHAIDTFASEPDGGLVVSGNVTAAYRATINTLAIQYRLPTFHLDRERIVEGGLIAYAPHSADLARRGASFADRILRGAKVGDLPVEYPTRFALFVNLKTARAMGLTMPETFLRRADEVIE
jgi:putative tryptophan/tyrosine transport system substrate-binding protein